MGTDIYKVTVLSVEDDVVVFNVIAYHPDNLPVPVNKPFAFQLILEPLWSWEDEHIAYARGLPITYEVDDTDLSNGYFWYDNAGGFIRAVEVLSSRNPDLSEEEWDEALLTRAYHLLPSVDLRVTATHRGWLLHLKKGMVLESRAYDMGEGKVWDDKTRFPGDSVWLCPADQSEGFKSVPPDEFTAEMGPTLLVPRFSSRHYQPDMVLTGDAISEEAVQLLVGRCIIFNGSGIFASKSDIVGTLLKLEDRKASVYMNTPFIFGVSRYPLSRLFYIGEARYRKRYPLYR